MGQLVLDPGFSINEYHLEEEEGKAVIERNNLLDMLKIKLQIDKDLQMEYKSSIQKKIKRYHHLNQRDN
jgi:hypothetical protein